MRRMRRADRRVNRIVSVESGQATKFGRCDFFRQRTVWLWTIVSRYVARASNRVDTWNPLCCSGCAGACARGPRVVSIPATSGAITVSIVARAADHPNAGGNGHVLLALLGAEAAEAGAEAGAEVYGPARRKNESDFVAGTFGGRRRGVPGRARGQRRPRPDRQERWFEQRVHWGHRAIKGREVRAAAGIKRGRARGACRGY
jgi:hypothetical protein